MTYNATGAMQFVTQHPWLTAPHTLDSKQTLLAVLYICTLLNIVVAVGRFVIREPKRLAWCMTLFSSGVSTVFSCFYCVLRLRNGVWSQNVIYGTDNVSYVMCLFFLCVNVMDLTWGCVLYRKHLELLTSWVHHPLYIILMLFAITTRFTQGFSLFMIEELPTFLLALGRISPKHRMDAAFGISFFVLRLLYHGFFTYYFISMNMHWGLIIFMLLTLGVHIFWFSTWFMKYGLPMLFPSLSKAKAKAKAE
jgi:hypothetical protein